MDYDNENIIAPVEKTEIPADYHRKADALRDEESSRKWDIYPDMLSKESHFYPKSWK